MEFMLVGDFDFRLPKFGEGIEVFIGLMFWGAFIADSGSYYSSMSFKSRSFGCYRDFNTLFDVVIGGINCFIGLFSSPSFSSFFSSNFYPRIAAKQIWASFRIFTISWSFYYWLIIICCPPYPPMSYIPLIKSVSILRSFILGFPFGFGITNSIKWSLLFWWRKWETSFSFVFYSYIISV